MTSWLAAFKGWIEQLKGYTRDLNDAETAAFIRFSKSPQAQQTVDTDFIATTSKLSCEETFRLPLRFAPGNRENTFDARSRADFARIIDRLQKPSSSLKICLKTTQSAV